MKKKEDIVFNK